MKYKYLSIAFLSLGFIFIGLSSLKGQDEIDEVAWLSQNLRLPISEKWRVDIIPIVRINEGLSRLSNVSFDLSVRYSMKKGFAASILNRTFFFSNQKPRRFIFFNLHHSFKNEESDFKFESYIRYHFAFDINERLDPDFVRPAHHIHYTVSPKASFMTGIEPFFEVGNDLKINQVRYKLGGTWKYRKKSSFNLQYWNQYFYGREFKKVDHMFVFTILHIIED